MKKILVIILIAIVLVGGVNLGLVKAEPFQFANEISTEKTASTFSFEDTPTPKNTLTQTPAPVRTEVIPTATPEPWKPPDLADYKDLLDLSLIHI